MTCVIYNKKRQIVPLSTNKIMTREDRKKLLKRFRHRWADRTIKSIDENIKPLKIKTKWEI